LDGIPRRLRELGLTQRWLAGEIGRSSASMSVYLSGKQPVPTAVEAQMLKALAAEEHRRSEENARERQVALDAQIGQAVRRLVVSGLAQAASARQERL